MDLTRKQMIEAFARSDRQIQNWETDGLPVKVVARRKMYPLTECIRWFREREVSAALEGVDTSAMDQAKLRKMEAEAMLREIEVQEKRGALVPITEVSAAAQELLEAADSVLRHSPARFSADLAQEAGVTMAAARVILGKIVELVRAAIRVSGQGAPNA